MSTFNRSLVLEEKQPKTQEGLIPVRQLSTSSALTHMQPHPVVQVSGTITVSFLAICPLRIWVSMSAIGSCKLIFVLLPTCFP